jgi:hypothetical protein
MAGFWREAKTMLRCTSILYDYNILALYYYGKGKFSEQKAKVVRGETEAH